MNGAAAELLVFHFRQARKQNSEGLRLPPKGGHMQSIVFCRRCRGMRVGLNARYVYHRLRCMEWVPKSSKLLILTVFLWIVSFSVGDPSASAFIQSDSEPVIQQAGFLPAAMVEPPKSRFNPAIRMIEGLLRAYKVDNSHCSRVAESIVRSSKKYDVDPRLIASISIVESRGNPFAVSNADSIGI